MNKFRILLADDHAVLRDGLKALVNAQPDMEVVGEADNGRSACLKARELLPDVVVMDISMPQMNGAQATKRLKESWPDMKVLALTAHEDKGYLRHLIETGASGFVLKRAATLELIQAIRVVATNGAYIDPTLAGEVLSTSMRKPRGLNASKSNDLSEREREVLRLVAWGYSNKEIGAQLRISVKTVETYKARLADKLDLKSRAEIVRYAVHQGWLQET